MFGDIQSAFKANETDRLKVVEQLRSVAMFSDCSGEFLQKLSAWVVTRTFDTGNEVCTEGESGTSLFIVAKGLLQVCSGSSPVFDLALGGWFGEANLLNVSDTWTVSVRAKTLSVVREIKREDFLLACAKFKGEREVFEEIGLQCSDRGVGGIICQNCWVFRNLSRKTVKSILSSAIPRLYFPGQRLCTEGADDCDLQVLVLGTVTVEIADRVVRTEEVPPTPEENRAAVIAAQNENTGHERIESFIRNNPAVAPVCFGEYGILGLANICSVSVVSQSCCFVYLVPRSVLRGMRLSAGWAEGEHQGAREAARENVWCKNRGATVEEHIVQIFRRSTVGEGPAEDNVAIDVWGKKRTSELTKVNPTADQPLLDFFRDADCSRDFIKFLGAHLEDRMYFPGQVILDNNLPEQPCLFICERGTVRVSQCSGSEMEGWTVFGEGEMFGGLKIVNMSCENDTTYTALTTCCVVGLHQTVVVRAVEIFQADREKIFSMTTHSESLDSGGNLAGADDSNIALNSEAVLMSMQKSALFQGMSHAFISELRQVAQDRVFMTGDLIMKEGTKGDSMFVMVSGSAQIFVSSDADRIKNEAKIMRGATVHQPGQSLLEAMRAVGHVKQRRVLDKINSIRVGELKPGSISGELVMLGLAHSRSASIEAQTTCVAWEVTHDDAVKLLEKHPDARAVFADIISRHLERTVCSRILGSKLFKDFERKFRTFVGLYCERQVCFPGQVVVREGEVGYKMFFSNLGAIELMKKGVNIMQCPPGAPVAAANMLGVTKVYLCTVVSLSMTHLLSITRDIFLQALEQYPAPKAMRALQASEKVAHQELQDLAAKVCTRVQCIKKYSQDLAVVCSHAAPSPLATSMQGVSSTPWGSATSAKSLKKLAGLIVLDTSTASKGALKVAMAAWFDYARTAVELRAKRAYAQSKKDDAIERWIRTKSERIDRLRHKQTMDMLVRHNIQERGPIVYPEDAIVQGGRITKRGSRSVRGAYSASYSMTAQARSSRIRPGPSVANIASDSRQLVDLLEEWPVPRSSPHYSLRVWDVLADRIQDEARTPAPLLPLLSSACSGSQAGAAATDCEISARQTVDGTENHSSNDAEDACDEVGRPNTCPPMLQRNRQSSGDVAESGNSRSSNTEASDATRSQLQDSAIVSRRGSKGATGKAARRSIGQRSPTPDMCPVMEFPPMRHSTTSAMPGKSIRRVAPSLGAVTSSQRPSNTALECLVLAGSMFAQLAMPSSSRRLST